MCGRQAEAGLRRAVEGSKRLREQGLEVVEQTIDDVTEVRQRMSTGRIGGAVVPEGEGV